MITTVIEESIPLAELTTMRVGGNAKFFMRVHSVEELTDAVKWAEDNDLPIFVLGGGSNTLVSDDGFLGLVIKMEIGGIQYEDSVGGARVIAGAGVRWDDLVRDVVLRDLWGIENLSLIPGTVGGAAVQNIGAYGVEARDTIAYVEVFDTLTKKIKRFSNEECAYGYRESIFKKDKTLIVVRVAFDLKKEGTPRTGYEDVKKYFTEKGVTSPSLKDIRDAIVHIRTAKMPAPPLGTAGSFFKNPVVRESLAEELRKRYPEMKEYPQKDGSTKLSAAWFLDHVGNWRGVRRGDAGVHEKQALILVNYGNARTSDVIALARAMKEDFFARTGVELEEEVEMMKSST